MHIRRWQPLVSVCPLLPSFCHGRLRHCAILASGPLAVPESRLALAVVEATALDGAASPEYRKRDGLALTVQDAVYEPILSARDWVVVVLVVESFDPVCVCRVLHSR